MDGFNPEMLVLARESRRMTQTVLAKRSGTTQGTISKAENGQLRPSTEVVGAWADALRYPPTLLARQGVSAGLPLTFFRKRASLPVTAARAIVANVALHREHIDRLARSVELPAPMITEVAPGESGTSPSQLAAELRIAWRLPRGPIENLTAALEDAGIVVVALDFGVDRIDGLSVWEHRRGSPPMMFINTRSPMDRLRFTMAHELGHLMMHMHQPIPPAACEDEADEFASEFLMPRTDIAPHLSDLTIERLVQLKAHWRVSMQSILVRADTLRRIAPSRATRLWKRLSSLGYRTREPIEIEREEPTMVRELVRVHIEDLQYSVEQLAATVDLLPDEFRQTYLGARPGLRLVQ